MAFDKEGNIHIVWRLVDSSGNDNIYYATSKTNYAPQMIAGGGLDYDHARIFIDSNDVVHILYTYLAGVNRHLWYVNNSGGSFSNNINITKINGAAPLYGSFDAEIDKEDIIHVTFSTELESGNDEVYYFSIKNGNPSQLEEISVNDSRSDINPQIKARSSIFITWCWAGQPLTQGYDIMCRYKIKGLNWSPPINITKTGGEIETCPDVALSDDGNFYIFYINETGYSPYYLWYYKNENGTTTYNNTNVRWAVSPRALAHADYDNNDNVHVLWYDGLDGDKEIYYMTNINGTFEFFNLTKNNIDDIYPFYVIDEYNNIHIVYSSNVSGTYDIYYMEIKYNTPPDELPPEKPVLLKPVANQSFVYLRWNPVSSADIYYIYMSNNPINNPNGYTPIKTIQSQGTEEYFEYQIEINSSGTYYFDIIAGNNNGNSSLSNCESITVNVNPPAPILITPIINRSIVKLIWTRVESANIYWVYMSNEVITDTSTLTPIKKIVYSGDKDYISCQITLNNSGTYYFAIVAQSDKGNSTISNSESVNFISETPQVSILTTSDVLIILLVIISSIILAIQLIQLYDTIREKYIKKQKQKPKPKTNQTTKKPIQNQNQKQT